MNEYIIYNGEKAYILEKDETNMLIEFENGCKLCVSIHQNIYHETKKS